MCSVNYALFYSDYKSIYDGVKQMDKNKRYEMYKKSFNKIVSVTHYVHECEILNFSCKVSDNFNFNVETLLEI